MTRWLLLLVALLAPLPARAIQIQYSLTPLGGDSYRYDYTVSNDGTLPAGAPVRLLDVMFDTELYEESSLAIVTPSPLADDWDEILLASAPDVPAAYDALATGAGIPSGGSAAGFAVTFHWLGAGTPGSQPFEISDPVTFDVLESGVTVPEPALGWLAASCAALLLAGRRASRQ
jgi:hypothetical protein